MLFIISTDDIALDYLGSVCDYRGSFDKDEWYEIPPHKIITFSTKLNDDYVFIPKDNFYNIRTADFTFVRNEWFIERSINEKMMSLISYGNMLYDNTVQVPFPLPQQNAYSFEKNMIADFMEKFDFDGSNSNNSVTIHSNQAYVEINGDKVKSLYGNNILD
ncbi:hypothetical protein ACN0IV_03215 [Trabulsiella odontotermitis]|uniref:hypothetical protein n=1 Tax=Trabulsiella odontotermitis TaxID=379893 RepID=UPI003ACF0D67